MRLIVLVRLFFPLSFLLFCATLSLARIVKNHPMGNYRAVDVDLMVYDLSSELNGVNSALLGLGTTKLID